MSKIYILDTNVLVAEPQSIFSFEDNTVILPSITLQEVDGLKKYMDEVGKNARTVAKLLDSLREKGSLYSGVELDGGGKIQIVNHHQHHIVYERFDDSNDNKIISVAYDFKEMFPDVPVILVSKDVMVRVRCDALGINAEDYLSDRVINDLDDNYTGFKHMYTDKEIVDLLYRGEEIGVKHFNLPLYENEFAIIEPFEGGGSVIARNRRGYLRKSFIRNDHSYFGIHGRNAGQLMALELMLDSNVPIVTLEGKAGTGKTLLALAVGLHLMEDEHQFRKLTCYRSIVPVGKDIGYLPGEKDEKLRPWLQPIYDNLEYIFNVHKQKDYKLDDIISGLGGRLEVDAITYIRGRSIPDQFIIVDEAQNLTKHEVKTMLTRVGEGSKIILMGDPQQIDHPYLDQYNNGLTYVIEKMKEHDIAGHVTLKKGERSNLAQLCADIL